VKLTKTEMYSANLRCDDWTAIPLKNLYKKSTTRVVLVLCPGINDDRHKVRGLCWEMMEQIQKRNPQT